MKNLTTKSILLLIMGFLILQSCKKSSNEKPIENTTTTTTISCKNELKQFTGKYKLNGGGSDTIEFVFQSDNCPEDNSNNYIVKNLGKAINNSNYSNDSIAEIDYIVKSNETSKTANTSDNTFKFILQTGRVVLQSGKLIVPQITFNKL